MGLQKRPKTSLQAPRGKSQGSKKRRVGFLQVTGTPSSSPCTIPCGPPVRPVGVCGSLCMCVYAHDQVLKEIAAIGWIYLGWKRVNFNGNTTQIQWKSKKKQEKALKTAKETIRAHLGPFEHIWRHLEASEQANRPLRPGKSSFWGSYQRVRSRVQKRVWKGSRHRAEGYLRVQISSFWPRNHLFWASKSVILFIFRVQNKDFTHIREGKGTQI